MFNSNEMTFVVIFNVSYIVKFHVGFKHKKEGVNRQPIVEQIGARSDAVFCNHKTIMYLCEFIPTIKFA